MYIVFRGEDYYPCGGVSDYYGHYNDLESAKMAVYHIEYEWIHILDTEKMEVYKYSGSECIKVMPVNEFIQ